MPNSPADWIDASADWSNAADWNTGLVPDAATDVTIAQGAPQVTATTGPAAAASVDVTAQLSLHDGALTVAGGLDNSGSIDLDFFNGEGGSTLSIGATFTNESGASTQIGDGQLSANDSVTAGAIDNAGSIHLFGNSAAGHQAKLVIAGAAGFGTAGVLSGDVELTDDALVEFGSGGISSIAALATLRLNGAQTFVADAGDLTHSSALTTLASNAGEFELENGASVTTTTAFVNSGSIDLDFFNGEGGSHLAIGGVLTNTGNIQIGNGQLSADDAISATGLVNTGGSIRLAGNSSAGHQAKLDISGAAGFGTAGALSGDVELTDDALVEFASGGITSIALGGKLRLNGAETFVADAGDLTHNSALTTLAGNAGELDVETGASVTTTTALANSGSIDLDFFSTEGGSHLAIGGTLTNTGNIQIGNGQLSADDAISAAGVANTGGSIRLFGNSAAGHQAKLDISGVAGFGTAGVLSGDVELTDEALVSFGSGQVTSIAALATLRLNGTETFVADAGDLTHNSALTTLAGNAGELDVENGATVTTTTALANSGSIDLDFFSTEGGGHLAVGGVLTNTGNIQIGNGQLSADDAISASGIANTGGSIRLFGNSAGGRQAKLDIAGAAGFGTAGVLSGDVELTDDVLVEFASGGISSIAALATLRLNGAQTFVADAGDLTHNSALTGLASNAGQLLLDNDATLTTTTDLDNIGSIDLDFFGTEGGVHLAVGGVLTNTGNIQIGNGQLSADDAISATGVANTSGTIHLFGDSAAGDQARLVIAGAAGFGTAGAVSGDVELTDDALVEFGSGGLTSIAALATLRLNGAQTFVADAGDLTHSSALTALASNAGEFELENGASVTTTTALANTGNIHLDFLGADGGSHLNIGGVLTNTGNIQIGGGQLSADDAISATGIVNTGGTIRLFGNSANSSQAKLDISGAAGFGTTGVVSGDVELSDDALIEFASGGITSIAALATLRLNGAQTFVADAGALTQNSALTGLANNAGEFDLENGASVATTTALANSGNINLDFVGADGGSHLAVGGVLTNTGGIQIGGGGLSADDAISATGVVNSGGTIRLFGNSTNNSQAKLDISSAAGFGTAGEVSGNVQLSGDALVEFASGGLTSIAALATLRLNGAETFVADAGDLTHNSALTTLASNAGEFDVENGASVTTTTALANSGSVNLDFLGGEGGSHLAVGGLLTNTGNIQLGQAQLSAADSITATGLSNTAGTIQLVGSATAEASLDIDGNASNAATLNIGADADVTLTAGHTYSQSAGTTSVAGTLDAASVDVAGGTLEGSGTVTGDVDNSATVLGGSSFSAPATLTLDGSYTQRSGAVLADVLTGTGAGQSGVLAVGGAVDLQGGTLQIDLANGFALAAGQSFTAMTFTPGSLTGTFATIQDGIFSGSVNSVNIAGGLTIDVVYDNAGGKIELDVVNSPVADNWLGGPGVWSNSAGWSSGVPTAQSLVDIGGTAAGVVSLDQNAAISQLTVEAAGSLEVLNGRTLDVSGAVLGSGPLLIDTNATLEIGAGETGAIGFSGAGATLRLDAPANFTGSIDDFGQGDTLALANTDVTGVSFAAGTLTATLQNGATLDFSITDNAGSGAFVVSHNGSESDITEISAPVLNVPDAQVMFTGFASQISPLGLADGNAGAGVMTVTIGAGNGILAAKASGAATVADSGTGALMLTGTLADINNELATVTYTGSSDGDDTITIVATDALGASVTRTIAVTDGPVPFTPAVVHAPANATLLGGTNTAIGDISVSDPYADATGKLVVLDISTDLPLTFTAHGTGGAVVGQGTNHVQIQGTTAEINSYLSDDLSGFVGLGLELATLQSQAKATAAFVKLVTEAVEPDNGDNAVFKAVPVAATSLAPPAAFFEVGASAVAYDFAAILSLLGGSPPSFEKFKKTLTEILAGKLFVQYFGSLPHVITPSGETYNFDPAGEFVMSVSTQPGDSFQVQARLQPYNGSDASSAMTQIGARVGDNQVTFGTDRSSTLWIDGSAVSLDPGEVIDLAAGEIGRISANVYRIDWNTGESILVTDEGSYLDLKVGLGPNDGPGTVIGLLGSSDTTGSPFILPDGTVLPEPLTTTELYQGFADAWRVQQSFSLLDYDAGQTTATFTDPTFPHNVLSLADFPSDIVARAAAAVAAAGITDPGLAAAAELDFIATGGDPGVIADDASNFAGMTTTPAQITLGPTPSVLGVMADAAAPIARETSGPTDVTFDVYLTKPALTDTVVNYQVVAAGAGFFTAAELGGVLPTGTLTIAAGDTTGSFTIAVPHDALEAPSEDLAVAITTPGDTPVFAATAQATVYQEPTAGPPAMPQITSLDNIGVFTRTANTYTLDLGDVPMGDVLPLLQFGINNAAAAGSDQLTGAFSVARVSGVSVTGANLPGPLDGGEGYQGLTVAINTGAFESTDSVKFGHNTETITFSPEDFNITGFDQPLTPLTLQINYNLTPPTMAQSYAWGDVHIITYNGLHYDFQGEGEFTLAKSRIPGDSFDIQMRLQPWFNGAAVSVITQTAVSVGTDKVTFDLTRPDFVYVDGVASSIDLAHPTVALDGGTLTELAPDTFKVTWDSGEYMTVSNEGSYLNIADAIPITEPGSIQGLQGEAEGQENDIQLPDGTVLPQPASADTLYGVYADAWRVTPATSLFDYPAGEGTDDFTDKNFPRDVVSLADLPADLVARAEQMAAAAGVTDPTTQQDAAYDYILTGDPRFLTGAQNIGAQAANPGATELAITGSTPVQGVGVGAVAMKVTEAASGSTPVTFEAFLTSAAPTDTTIDYQVIAPDAGFLGASAFGGTLPTGTVTILAGQTTAQFTVDVPPDALGALASDNLEVEISAPGGQALIAPVAQSEIVSDQPVPGTPAAAALQYLGTVGTFAHVGNAYTLDLGSLTQAAIHLPLDFAILNTAGAGADDLGGMFATPTGSGFTVSGTVLPNTIHPGLSYQGLEFAPTPNVLGSHSMTITFTPTDVNDSGYSASLDPITLTVIDSVAKPAIAALNTPDSIIFANVRVGTVETRQVGISNTATAPAQGLDVTPIASLGATTSGSITQLAAGGTDSTSIVVGLDTSHAGAGGGYVTLSASSDGGNGETSPIDPSPIVDVFGGVYRVATAAIDPLSEIVHVGDTGTAALSVSNTDVADGYSESLIAAISAASGDVTIAAGGPSGDIAAGASDASSLLVGFSTTAAGVLTGTATLALTTDGGLGTGSIDGLGTLALDSQDAAVTITVNNYANAVIEKLSGSGTLTANGGDYTLDLGDFDQGTGPVTVDLGVLNDVLGPSDLLSGSFTPSGPTAFTLSGFTSFSGLAAGEADTAPEVTFSTTDAGFFTETITLNAIGSNASGYSAARPVETLTIIGTVEAANTVPVITAPASALLQQGIAQAVGGVSVADADGLSGETYTVTLADADGLLSANTGAAGGGGTIGGSGTETLTLSGTLAEINADVTTLSVTDSSLAADTITITAGDSNGGIAAAKSIELDVNAAPTTAAPASLLVQQGAATAIAGVSVSDADSLGGETYTVTLSDAHGPLSANTGATGGGGSISGAGTTTLTLSGTLAQVNADLTTLGVTDGSLAADIISMATSDNKGGSAAAKSIELDVNAAPVIAVPGTLALSQGVAAPVAGVSISDGDTLRGETYTVTLSDAHGLLSANTGAIGGGGTIGGDATASLTISGTLAQVNADLSTLAISDSNAGADQISVAATDSKGGTATPQSITIAVSSPNPITVTIDPVTGDNVLTYAEAHDAGGVPVTGKVTGLDPGSHFTLEVVDASIVRDFTATVGANGTWTATIASVSAVLLANGTATFTAKASDTVKASEPVTIADLLPTVTINPVNGNDVIDEIPVPVQQHGRGGYAKPPTTGGAASAPVAVPLSGTVSGIAANSSFTVTVTDGKITRTYTARVNSAGTAWTASIPAPDAAALPTGLAIVSARVTDSHGNVSVPAYQDVTVKSNVGTAATITGSQRLVIGGASSENVNFAAGGNGTLELDSASGFAGAISGFVHGDGIDLKGIAYQASGLHSSSLSFTEAANGQSGTLKASAGASVLASVTLLGNYMAASFAETSDGHGGTLITTQQAHTDYLAPSHP